MKSKWKKAMRNGQKGPVSGADTPIEYSDRQRIEKEAKTKALMKNFTS